MERSIIDKLFKIDKTIIVGLGLIILGFIILVTDFIDSFVTNLLWPLLEGSSEGKTVLFLGMLGLILIISSLINQNSSIRHRLYPDNNYHLKYILFVVVILLCCAVLGLIIEFYIRYKLGISFFTILTSLDPSTSTTSPMHSHAYKSILGYLSKSFVPAHVNTSSSILKFVFPYALIVVPIWIVSFICGVIGLSDMKPLHKAITTIALTLALIGILDGGMFSQPFLIGIGFLLLMYFSNGKIGIKYFIKPVVIMGYILLVGMIIEVGGSDMSHHTLSVINQTEPVDMTQYNVTNIEVHGDVTTYTLATKTDDKQLIRQIFASFKGKADVTFMSWNFYSYLDNPTMRQRQAAKNIS